MQQVKNGHHQYFAGSLTFLNLTRSNSYKTKKSKTYQVLYFAEFNIIHRLLEITRNFSMNVEQNNNQKQLYFYIETTILKGNKIT